MHTCNLKCSFSSSPQYKENSTPFTIHIGLDWIGLLARSQAGIGSRDPFNHKERDDLQCRQRLVQYCSDLFRASPDWLESAGNHKNTLHCDVPKGFLRKCWRQCTKRDRACQKYLEFVQMTRLFPPFLILFRQMKTPIRI